MLFKSNLRGVRRRAWRRGRYRRADTFHLYHWRHLSLHAGQHVVECDIGGIHTVLRHVAVVCSLHVVLHLVGPRELLAADRAREHFPLLPLMVQESVSLEWILVFESLLYVLFCAFGALVDSFVDGGVSEEVEASDGHFCELFGGVVGGGIGSSPDPSPGGWSLHVVVEGVVVVLAGGGGAGGLRRRVHPQLHVTLSNVGIGSTSSWNWQNWTI